MQVNIQYHGLSNTQNVSLAGSQPSHRESLGALEEEMQAKRG